MTEPLEIRILRSMVPSSMAYTLPWLAARCDSPLGSVRAAMARLQRDDLVEKWRVGRGMNRHSYGGQKTAIWYRLTEEGRKLHRELRYG